MLTYTIHNNRFEAPTGLIAQGPIADITHNIRSFSFTRALGGEREATFESAVSQSVAEYCITKCIQRYISVMYYGDMIWVGQIVSARYNTETAQLEMRAKGGPWRETKGSSYISGPIATERMRVGETGKTTTDLFRFPLQYDITTDNNTARIGILSGKTYDPPGGAGGPVGSVFFFCRDRNITRGLVAFRFETNIMAEFTVSVFPFQSQLTNAFINTFPNEESAILNAKYAYAGAPAILTTTGISPGPVTQPAVFITEINTPFAALELQVFANVTNTVTSPIRYASITNAYYIAGGTLAENVRTGTITSNHGAGKNIIMTVLSSAGLRPGQLIWLTGISQVARILAVPSPTSIVVDEIVTTLGGNQGAYSVLITTPKTVIEQIDVNRPQSVSEPLIQTTTALSGFPALSNIDLGDWDLDGVGTEDMYARLPTGGGTLTYITSGLTANKIHVRAKTRLPFGITDVVDYNANFPARSIKIPNAEISLDAQKLTRIRATITDAPAMVKADVRISQTKYDALPFTEQDDVRGEVPFSSILPLQQEQNDSSQNRNLTYTVKVTASHVSVVGSQVPLSRYLIRPGDIVDSSENVMLTGDISRNTAAAARILTATHTQDSSTLEVVQLDRTLYNLLSDLERNANNAPRR